MKAAMQCSCSMHSQSVFRLHAGFCLNQGPSGKLWLESLAADFWDRCWAVSWCGVISGDEEMHTHNTEQLQPPSIRGVQHRRPAILRYVRQGRTFNSDISFSSKHLASIVHHTFHNGLGSLLEFRTDRTDGLLRIKSCAVYIHTVIKKSRWKF